MEGDYAAEEGPVAAPADEGTSAVMSWERAWSLDEMRDGSTEWNLAADAGVRTTRILCAMLSHCSSSLLL